MKATNFQICAAPTIGAYRPVEHECDRRGFLTALAFIVGADLFVLLMIWLAWRAL